MSKVIHIGTAASLATISKDDIVNADISYIWLNSYTRKMVYDDAATNADDIVNHPYYIQPYNYVSAGVWVEDVGADQPQVWDGAQIVTGKITSTNWAADAGSQFDLGAGTLEIRQSGGGITVAQGGDINLEGGVAGDPSLINLTDGADTNPAEIRFVKAGDATKYWRMYKRTSGNDPLYIGPSSALDTAAKLYIGKSDEGYLSRGIYLDTYATGEIALAVAGGCSLIISPTKATISHNLTVTGGIIAILETTTPVAVDSYGRIYTKNDNNLYFQDGAGSENIVATLDGSENLIMIDNAWVGLGAAKGRIEFDDQAIDEINFLDCYVGIGTSAPTAPLTFAASVGQKIDLYVGTKIGLGVQSNLFEFNGHSSDVDFTFGYGTSGSLTKVMTIEGTGNVGIGIAAPVAKTHIDQASTTAAQPVLILDQADVSEEFIKFIGTAAAATLTRSIVAEADVSTATRAGFLKINVQDDGNRITDQAYFLPIYTLA